jgi:Zn-dependent peptidase ImmA (M78 family)/transcriptional regulator with XRE-family HTH domain
MTGNGDMLRLARQRRGFQQTDAARALGIDQSMLSRFENGLVDVREDLISKAAKVYDLPEAFFQQRDPVYGAPVSVHPMWRRKADVSTRALDSVIAELNLRVMHLRRLCEGAEIANTNNLPRMDIEEYGDPERVAATVRAHWRVPPGPLKNLTSLVEKAGVLVCLSRLSGTSISGVTFAPPGMPPLVALNSEQPADRLRFTLAHELAHLVMHRFPTPDMEQEANAFAVALLMPATDIRPYFLGRRIELSILAALKPEWKVSMAALLMRAHALKFISENQYRYLWKQISARGYRLREPPELDFEPEEPEVIRKVIRLHLDGLGFSMSELARLLCVHEHELRALYGIPEGDTEPKRAKLTVLK